MGIIATGIPNLDAVLGGGLRESYLVVVAGGPGTGKTVFVQQIASSFARQGGKVLYVTALSEPHSALLAHLSGFAFFDRSLLGERIKLINVLPIARQGLGAVTATIMRTLRDEKTPFLIFDGFRSLRDILANEREVRGFIYELVGMLSAVRTTALFTSELGPAQAAEAPEALIADGLITLRYEWSGLHGSRFLEVVKLRGAQPLEGPHAMDLSNEGMVVYPRPESVYVRPTGLPPAGRAAFGVSGLDRMLNGGLPRGSATLVMGGPGVGKTLLGLHFVGEGAREGEAAVFVSFHETPERLLAKAAGFGLDLAGASAGGLLSVLHYPGTEVNPDRIVWGVWEEAERIGARRVVVESVGHLESEIGAARLPGFLMALASHLRAKGVTVCFTKEVEYDCRPLLDVGQVPLSAVADNVLTMRMVESHGELRYVMAVVKMRDSAHERVVREYTIGAPGLEVGAVFEGG